MTELKNWGVKDILIACVDGLKGFPDVINILYPQTQIQLYCVHDVQLSELCSQEGLQSCYRRLQ